MPPCSKSASKGNLASYSMQVLKALKFKKSHCPIEMHFIFLYYTIMKEMDGFFSAGIMEYWNIVRDTFFTFSLEAY